MRDDYLMDDQLLRPRDAARLMGWSPRTLRRKTQQGELPSYGRDKLIRYRMGDLREWQKGHRNEGELS